MHILLLCQNNGASRITIDMGYFASFSITKQQLILSITYT
jgi:hypothetical protein